MMPDPTLTQHAAERIAEMGVTFDEVVDAVTAPEIRYASRYQNDRPGVEMAKGGRVAVVWNTITGEVITVLWHHDRPYRRCPQCGSMMVDGVGYTGRAVWHCDGCGLNQRRKGASRASAV